MRSHLRTTVGFVAVASLMSATVNAAVINVPADFASIQDAIIAAACGDEIVVAPGTYNEARSIDFLDKAITLRSSGGPDATTIDGTGLNVPVVQCIMGEGPSTVLRGFTITGADALLNPGARGMLNDGSSPTISHCIFLLNLGGDGAGMLNVNNSNPWVENCTFINNSVPDGIARHGGGMENGNSSPTVISCTFIGNTVSGGSNSNRGGGMLNGGGSNPQVINCTFAGNSASGGGISEGGAMWNSADSLPIVSGSSFCQNTPDDISGRWTDAGGNVFGMCRSADTTGPSGVPDGCVDAFDLGALLGAWCSVAGGNPCGTCFP